MKFHKLLKMKNQNNFIDIILPNFNKAEYLQEAEVKPFSADGTLS